MSTRPSPASSSVDGDGAVRVGLVALVFGALGLWLGRRMTGTPKTIVVREFTTAAPEVVSEAAMNDVAPSRPAFTPDTCASPAGHHAVRAEQVEATRKQMAEFAVQYRKPLINIGYTFIEVFPVGLAFALVTAGVLRSRRRPGDVGASARGAPSLG